MTRKSKTIHNALGSLWPPYAALGPLWPLWPPYAALGPLGPLFRRLADD